MLRRKIYDQLLSWKAKKHENGMKECLLIKGARQVGKSYIVEQFGKENYESFVSINFITHPELKKAFEGNKSPERIYSNLSILLPDIRLIPGNTLIFLDEIQNCGDARTAIKFLASDPRYDFIASGSLLGLEYGEDGDEGVEVPESIPVGYESEIIMFPLDFEEYLWAKGYEGKHIDQLREYFDKKEKVLDFIKDNIVKRVELDSVLSAMVLTMTIVGYASVNVLWMLGIGLTDCKSLTTFTALDKPCKE